MNQHKYFKTYTLLVILFSVSLSCLAAAQSPEPSPGAGKLLDMMFSGEVPFWFEKSEENAENKKDW